MSRPRFEDLTCPRCGHRHDFHVDITATAYLDSCGPSVEGDYYWDKTSDCSCLGCYYGGSVADFVRVDATSEPAADSMLSGGVKSNSSRGGIV